jgi:hypothetical protein
VNQAPCRLSEKSQIGLTANPLRQALASELTDDDLAAIAAGASLAHDKPAEDPKPGKSELN